MNLGKNATEDSRRIAVQLPWYLRLAKPEIIFGRRALKAISGAYIPQRIEYSLCIGGSPMMKRFI